MYEVSFDSRRNMWAVRVDRKDCCDAQHRKRRSPKTRSIAYTL